MTTFLLTWNPARWTWPALKEIAQKISAGYPHEVRWSCGNNRKLPVGARVFLLRQGVEPKGVVGSGWVVRAPYASAHWDEERASKGGKAFYIDYVPDALIDPDIHTPLDLRKFNEGPLSNSIWRIQSSGITLEDAVAHELEVAWSRHLPFKVSSYESPVLGIRFEEGHRSHQFRLHRSREWALRNRKIEAALAANPDGRLLCEVPNCGFDFEVTYGQIGEGFIEVHHLRPLSEADGPTVTSLDDLAIVCSNCHAMIHRGGECRPIGDLIACRSVSDG
jgi:5-methylcytosine-specific restriction protein A